MEDYKFLKSKYDELDRKVFDLEEKVAHLEELVKALSPVSVASDKCNVTEVNSKTQKYAFNGDIYKKNQLLLAVIKEYVKNNPSITFEELQVVFPDKLAVASRSFGVVRLLSLVDEKHKKGNGRPARYFMDSDDIIKLADGDVVVSTQWGSGNIDVFIEAAEKLGFVITRL